MVKYARAVFEIPIPDEYEKEKYKSMFVEEMLNEIDSILGDGLNWEDLEIYDKPYRPNPDSLHKDKEEDR